METMFEVWPPGGQVIRVLADGTSEGLPAGTLVHNGWLAALQYAAGLTKKALSDGLGRTAGSIQPRCEVRASPVL